MFDIIITSFFVLVDWLVLEGCMVVVMEVTGVYWKLVWYVFSDGDFELVLVNAERLRMCWVARLMLMMLFGW